jgi:hypothetical protein
MVIEKDYPALITTSTTGGGCIYLAHPLPDIDHSVNLLRLNSLQEIALFRARRKLRWLSTDL